MPDRAAGRLLFWLLTLPLRAALSSAADDGIEPAHLGGGAIVAGVAGAGLLGSGWLAPELREWLWIAAAVAGAAALLLCVGYLRYRRRARRR